MNDPQQQWDEQLRAALNEKAGSIEAVTPWTPPTERRNGRHPWRWLTPLAAAAAVLVIVIGAAVARISADRDVRPATPAPLPPTAVTTTVVPTTRAVEPTPTSRSASAPSVTRTVTPVGPAPTTPARPTVNETPSATATRTTAPRHPTATSASASASATITPCMRQYTYESVSAEWSGVHGIQFSGLSELASCGGPDDVNWSPTGQWFPLHLSTTTRIFVLRPGGQGDQSLPLAKFSSYLSHPFTGLFVITGPSTSPTTLTEIYHP